MKIRIYRDGHFWIGYGYRVSIWNEDNRLIFSRLFVDYSKREAESLARAETGLKGKHMERI